MASEQDVRITDAVSKERARLRKFIRRRVDDVFEAEDILQDVFYELVAAYRSAETIEQVSAWLFRVTRNKITDLFRKKSPKLLDDEVKSTNDEGEPGGWEDSVASAEPGPEDLFLHNVLAEELDDALAELPEEQQQVFIAHEIEGRSFKEIADETGVNLNTLLSRKRYAVIHLRRRLQAAYDEIRK
jgi:RNA polymerase sigma factor (sigma-70 family)